MVINCSQQHINKMRCADILNIIEKFIPQSLTWPDFLGNQHQIPGEQRCGKTATEVG